MKQQSPSGWHNKKWGPKSRIKHPPDLISTLKLATVAYCTMCLQLASQLQPMGQPSSSAQTQTQTEPVQWPGPETSMSANLSSGPVTARQMIVEQPVSAAPVWDTTNAAFHAQTELGYKADNATANSMQEPPPLEQPNPSGNGHSGIEILAQQQQRHGEPAAAGFQEQLIKTSTDDGRLLAEQPDPLLMGEQATVLAPSTSSAASAAAATDAADTADRAANDEDVVISSSEILTDNRQLASLQPMNQKPSQRRHNKQQEQDLLQIGGQPKNCSREFSAADGGLPNDGIYLGSLLAANSAAPADADLRHHLNSRLLLQIIVVGLFGLVSLSLMVVYTIKFCICRRRKRLMVLRRNLVADSAALACQPRGCASLHRAHPAEQCTCPAGSAILAPEPPARLESLLCPYTPGGLWTVGGRSTPLAASDSASQLLTPSLQQQLALAERLARQHMAGPMSGPACTFCLACGDPNLPSQQQRQHQHHNQQHQQQQQQWHHLQRPPTYSELFGGGADSLAEGQSPTPASSGPPISPAPTASLPTGSSRQAEADAVSPRTTSEELSSSSAHAETIAGDSQNWLQQNQKNLLVKLNLNKTKLLSADDLVLLSQLIDVPIIVQHQHQHQQPPVSSPSPAPAPAASSCSDDATINEEPQSYRDGSL